MSTKSDRRLRLSLLVFERTSWFLHMHAWYHDSDCTKLPSPGKSQGLSRGIRQPTNEYVTNEGGLACTHTKVLKCGRQREGRGLVYGDLDHCPRNCA